MACRVFAQTIALRLLLISVSALSAHKWVLTFLLLLLAGLRAPAQEAAPSAFRFEHLTVDQGAALDVDASGPQSGTVGARSNVVKQGDWYYMAYECCTAAKDFGQAQWGTALARSRTPSGGWEKLDTGPIIANPKTGYGFDGPELSQQDGRLYLYYRMGGNSTARREITGLG